MDEELIQDEALGPLLWDEQRRWWLLRVGRFDGRRVMGYIFPDDQDVPMSGVQFEAVRGHVAWVRENEPAMMAFVVERMFPWWLHTDWAERRVGEIATAEQFKSHLHLECVHFQREQAHVCYNAGDLIDYHTFWLVFPSPGVLPKEVKWG